MRILVIAACPLPWPRGTPIRIHRMAEALVDRGHEVHAVTYPLGDRSTPTPYTVHRVGWRGAEVGAAPGPSLKKMLVFDPLLIRKVRRLLDEIDFDVLHAHHYEGLIAGLVARRSRHQVPIVYDGHTLLATELPHYRLPIPSTLLARIGRWLDGGLPPRADHVIAVTAVMCEWFKTEGALPDDRVSLIQNGVEHEHFSKKSEQEHRASSGDPTAPKTAERPCILYTGNLARYQGMELLLAAFQKVRVEIPRARLILATHSGCGTYTLPLEELGMEDCVSIVQIDYEDLPARLAAADVLVNARPDCGGLPQKLLNYMAAGRPIVSFSGSAALLEHERTALLVPDENIDRFAAEITRILRDPPLARRLGSAARDQVIAEHGWRQVAERLESVYAHAIAVVRSRSVAS